MDAALDVPGARIYYKARGAGPVLLLLPGGDGDADAVDALAAHLEHAFTVVTHDRRGLSRSTCTGVPPDLVTHAEDASRVLAAVTDGPALVFGGSIGAAIALELVTGHPEQVGYAVVHEAPIGALLPDDARDELVRGQLEVEDAFRREGVRAAMARFMQLGRMDFTDREPDVQLNPPRPDRLSNLEFFLTHDAPAVRRHQPDRAAIRAQADRIIPALGAASTGPVAQCAHALADLLNAEAITFPGGHNGYTLRPRAFAQRLREVLQAVITP